MSTIYLSLKDGIRLMVTHPDTPLGEGEGLSDGAARLVREVARRTVGTVRVDMSTMKFPGTRELYRTSRGLTSSTYTDVESEHNVLLCHNGLSNVFGYVPGRIHYTLS